MLTRLARASPWQAQPLLRTRRNDLPQWQAERRVKMHPLMATIPARPAAVGGAEPPRPEGRGGPCRADGRTVRQESYPPTLERRLPSGFAAALFGGRSGGDGQFHIVRDYTHAFRWSLGVRVPSAPFFAAPRAGRRRRMRLRLQLRREIPPQEKLAQFRFFSGQGACL